MNRPKGFPLLLHLALVWSIFLAAFSPALASLARAFDSAGQAGSFEISPANVSGSSAWCVAGSFQGWNNASDPMNDTGANGDLVADDGIFSLAFTVPTADRYEFKVVECGNWGNAHPSQNAWFFTTNPNQNVRFTFDTNDHSTDAGAAATPTTSIVHVTGDTLPASFTAVGDWQGWNNSDPNTAMTHVGNGLYWLKYTVASAGSYMAKVVQTGSWNEQFVNDGRAVDGPVINFTTTNPNEEMIFLLDTRASRVTVTPNSSGTGNWCVAGAFQGWDNDNDPLNDSGANGDLIGGDGVFSLDFTVATAGRHEWKIVECGNWGITYPAQNSWINTTSPNQVVKFTFDTNDHSNDAGWPLVPATNIVNAWDSLPTAFNAVGDFQGWNNGDPGFTLTDQGNGVHTLNYAFPNAGSYIGKITTTGSWDAFGNDGRSVDAQNLNINVAEDGDTFTFLLDTVSGRLAAIPPQGAPPPPPPTGCTSGAAHDHDIWWGDLGHNSRDTLYRTPGGPVETNTAVTLRFRAACGDLTGVQLRVWNDRIDVQTLYNLTLVQQQGPYEWWQVTLPASALPTVYWYRFIAKDGASTAYYEDDARRDGGWGQTFANSQDYSWQLTHYAPDFQTPDWVKNAVIYQIFTDRFKDGYSTNNTPAGTFFYNETPTIFRSTDTAWNTPVCDPRDGGSACPGVYSQNFYGGDLQGIIDKLDYLESLGVTALYLNPIFESPSNHKYDTTDFSLIDDNFGDLALFQSLVTQASARGMSIILDGVFNHTSSDSIYFDRYGRYPEVGACESHTSPYRAWYYFTDVTPGAGPCVGSTGTPNAATYTSWFGYDSLPKLNAANPEVRDLIWSGGPNAIARFWVEPAQGADGWRLDVGGDVDPGTLHDPNNTYWEGFREAVHQSNPEAYIVGEEWGNATSWVIDNQWDATMNYQYSSLMMSFWRDEPFVDNDHNAGSSAGILAPITPAQLNEGLLNWIERYPPEALAAMMNLLGSHDTNRPLFMLDHNTDLNDDTIYDNPNYDWSESIARLKGVIILQMTLPGAPTVYYGDEVGTVGQVTWDGSTWQDDPYNRQPYPWLDETGTPFYTHLQSQASQDALFDYYALLAAARNTHPALRTGSFDPLLVDNANNVYAYGRKMADHSDAALVLLNRAGSINSPVSQDVTLNVAGYLPYGATFIEVLTEDQYVVDANGLLTVTVPGQSGAILVLDGAIAAPPGAIGDLSVTAERSEELDLGWTAATGATSYDVYRSLFSGGGYTWVANTPNTFYTDTGLQNAVTYHYVIVSKNDTTGLVSGFSNEAAGTPHHDLSAAWYNLQSPPTITHTISTITPTVNIYGQLWINGATGGSGPASGITAQIGYAFTGTLPITGPGWAWVTMAYDSAQGNNDQFVGNLLPDYLGTYWYATRYSSDGGQTWYYADLDGPGFDPAQAGIMWVVPSSDLTAPDAPQNLTLDGTTTSSIEFSWDANSEDDLAGYEVYRQEISTTLRAPAGGFVRITQLGNVTSYSDLSVVADHTYEYYVLAYDTSFNRSAPSNVITATAEARLALVTINVTVPPGTPGTVFIAGNIPGLPEWNPGATPLTAGISNTWSITLTQLDGTQFDYKFARGNWDTVEKEADGNTEIPNRQLTVEYGDTGVQIVNLTVANWRDPFVIATSPANGATGVDADAAISVTWNQAMPPSSDFTVTGPSGGVGGTFGYDPGSYTVTFTPTQALEAGATYTVTVIGEVDVAGDVQQVPTLFSFSTAGTDVALSMTDSGDPVLLGSVFTYTLSVDNLGPDAATNVVLTTTLPAEFGYVSDNAGCGESSGVVVCAIGSVLSGEAVEVHIAVTANQTGTFTTTATVTLAELDVELENNTASEATTVTAQSADLSITLADSADPVTVGEWLTYTIMVANDGPNTASNVSLMVTFPAGVGYLSDDAGCSEVSGLVTCALGDLVSGGTVVVQIVVSADQAGLWDTTAEVTSDAADTNVENNTTTESTTVNEVPEQGYDIFLPLLYKP